MKYTRENMEKLADKIVNDMDTDQLLQAAYEDLLSLFIDDEESFDLSAKDFDE